MSWAVVALQTEINPNWVRPGWTPLLVLIGLALVLSLLFVSMRRQFTRIRAPYADEVDGVVDGVVDGDPTAEVHTADARPVADPGTGRR